MKRKHQEKKTANKDGKPRRQEKKAANKGDTDGKPRRQERKVRQHTVPESYLRRFLAARRNSLFVFNKETQAVYENSVSNISVENGFYDLPPEVERKFFSDGKHDPQFLENGLAEVESYFKADLDEFLANVATRGITVDDRVKLAPFIAIQWMRGREYRETIKQIQEKMQHAMFIEWCKTHHPEIPLDEVEICVEYDRRLLPLDQTRALLSADKVEEAANSLCNHIWFVGINQTTQPFYTSDNPVVRKAHVEKPGRRFIGFKAAGVQIAFPLSSTHILIMCERKIHTNRVGQWENRLVQMNAIGVDTYNQMQVRQSYRQVYCGKNEFEQAKGTCRRFPEICKPNRERITVTKNGDTIGFLCSQ